jgi:hypothetical protein
VVAEEGITPEVNLVRTAVPGVEQGLTGFRALGSLAKDQQVVHLGHHLAIMAAEVAVLVELRTVLE